jgi:hypothetical protein
MSDSSVVLYGTLRPDGTLELEGKPDLPAGRVKVFLEAVRERQPGEPGWWEILQQIKQEQAARGFRGRSREEIDAEIAAERAAEEEYEERWRQIWSQTQGPTSAEEKP